MPAHRKLTRIRCAEVVGAVKAGTTKEQAAAIVGVTVAAIDEACTRWPWFAEDLEAARTLCDGTAVRSLFRLVLEGNVTACVWWTKARMGWHEPSNPSPPTTLQALSMHRRPVTGRKR